MASPRPPAWSIPNPIPWEQKAVEGVGSNLGGAVKGTVSAAKFLSDPVRVGEALVGLMLLGIGITAALKGTPVAGTATSAAGTVATVAKIIPK